MAPLLILVLVGVALAQPHHGHEAEVACYECGGPHGNFPDCLNHVHHCHHDEICQVNYGGEHTEIRCHKEHDCTREVNDANRQCSTGGANVHNSCQICCADANCMADALKAMNQTSQVTNHKAVHCPADCPLDNLAQCVSQGHVCNDHQYCKVSVDDGNGHVHGRCEDLRDINHCQDEVADQHCDPHHHNCVKSCCTDDQCVAGNFGSTSTLYEFLKGDCVDQLEGNQCATLDSSKHLCNDELALRVCPKTCGLCSLYNASDCHDTVANNGCQDMLTANGVCTNPLAQYICPVTCNMCDALLQEKIKEALQNGHLVTQDPGVINPDVNTVTCSDLVDQDCSLLATICPKVNCPNECSDCMVPMPMTTMAAGPMASSVGGLSALTCDQLAGLGCGALDAVCPTVNCPSVCDPCFNPIVTVPMTPMAPVSMDTAVTSADVSVPPSAASSCVDTIQDMNCADVEDVCSSPLLIGYCQKYCGAC